MVFEQVSLVTNSGAYFINSGEFEVSQENVTVLSLDMQATKLKEEIESRSKSPHIARGLQNAASIPKTMSRPAKSTVMRGGRNHVLDTKSKLRLLILG